MGHHSGLYHRPDSREWQYCIYVRGRRYRGTTGIPLESPGSKTRARGIVDQIRAAIITRRYEGPGAIPFAELAGKYENAVKIELDGGHLRNTLRHVAFWRDIFTDRMLDSITREDVEQAREGLLLRKGPRDQALSHACVNGYVQTLRHLLQRSVEWGHVSRNVAAGRGLKLPTPPARDRILADYEIAQIRAACKPPLHQLVTVALCSGARLGELAQAEWGRNVNLAGRELVLHAAETKTRKPRLIPLNRSAIEAFMSLPGRAEGGRIWSYRKDTLSRQFRDALRQAGITGATFHSIRHTVASRLHTAAVPVGIVARLLGHATTGTTLKTYVHVQRAELEQAVKLLELDGREGGFEAILSTFSATVARNP